MPDPATITVPELSLIVLIGPSGCGKLAFASDHFLLTEMATSDARLGDKRTLTIR